MRELECGAVTRYIAKSTCMWTSNVIKSMFAFSRPLILLEYPQVLSFRIIQGFVYLKSDGV